MVIRSLNVLYWLGNLSKTFSSWTVLITHKMTEQTQWEANSNLERGGQRKGRQSLCPDLVSVNTEPFQPQYERV